MFFTTQQLENIISEARVLLKNNKNDEALQLLSDANDKINEYYEWKYPMHKHAGKNE